MICSFVRGLPRAGTRAFFRDTRDGPRVVAATHHNRSWRRSTARRSFPACRF